MKRKNTMRNALFTSIISMLLCVSMLVGTTFAWFTDEVVSGRNTIAAGNLDIELLANGNKVDGNTVLFDNERLWEPGAVVYENLQICPLSAERVFSDRVVHPIDIGFFKNRIARMKTVILHARLSRDSYIVGQQTG